MYELAFPDQLYFSEYTQFHVNAEWLAEIHEALLNGCRFRPLAVSQVKNRPGVYVVDDGCTRGVAYFLESRPTLVEIVATLDDVRIGLPTDPLCQEKELVIPIRLAEIRDDHQDYLERKEDHLLHLND